MGTRRNEARENLGTEREFEAEGPMEEALNGYYELGAEASDNFGNFDVEKYQDLREAYQATLTQMQQQYILRNTNMTRIARCFAVSCWQRKSPKEFQKIRASDEARRRQGGGAPR